MARYLVVAALLLQATLTAQDRAPMPNPFIHDPFWDLHTASVRYTDLLRSKSTDPVEAIAANFALGNKLAAVRSARGLITANSAQLVKGIRQLIEHSHDLNDDSTTLHAEFLRLVADLRKTVEPLSGEDGADAASAMLTLQYLADRGNETAHTERVQAFLARYAGTRAALRMEVSRVDASRLSRDRDEWLRRYRELARKYDRTEAGAMALYYVGSRQAHCCHAGSDAPEVERLLEVFDVVKELESGRFPQSEWVERAPLLVSEFFFGSDAKIDPAVMPQLYDRYLEFVLKHPVINAMTIDGGVEWIVRDAVSRLAPTPIERVSIVEAFLEDLEKGSFGINNIRFLRAKFYFSLTDPGWIADHMKGGLDHKEAEARAIRNLRTIIESRQPAEAVKAEAMLAAHFFGDGKYADARSHLMVLREQYPDAEWNWVAALRIAQIHERLGQKPTATDYEAVALRKNLPPAAVLLSRISAAELREQAGELPAAAAHYQEAMAAWQSLADPIHLFAVVPEEDAELHLFRRFADLKKSDIIARLERLSSVVSTEEALLYEGRRALELNKPREAMSPLKRLIESYPKSTAAAEGRRLLRRAQFSDILTTPQKDAATADRNLSALAAGPYDSVTTLSKLARAALKIRTNAVSEAESLVKQALEEWQAKQSTTVDPASPLAADVAAIRVELFRPQGGGVFGKRGWNAFEWPSSMPPFAIVTSDIQVKTSDGKERRLSVPFAANTGARVVFASYEDLGSMRMILDKIGGTETAEWINAMDLPNQPIGGSVQIAQLWAKFFPLRPGHWGGWELTVYPYVTKITFDRDGHALADFTAGYSGGTVELEKENGVWVAKRIINIWIT